MYFQMEQKVVKEYFLCLKDLFDSLLGNILTFCKRTELCFPNWNFIWGEENKRLPKVEVTIKEIDYTFVLDKCLLQFLGIATARRGLACVDRFNKGDFSDFCYPERSKASNYPRIIVKCCKNLGSATLFFFIFQQKQGLPLSFSPTDDHEKFLRINWRADKLSEIFDQKVSEQNCGRFGKKIRSEIWSRISGEFFAHQFMSENCEWAPVGKKGYLKVNAVRFSDCANGPPVKIWDYPKTLGDRLLFLKDFAETENVEMTDVDGSVKKKSNLEIYHPLRYCEV